jgi:hypothetical protein
VKYTLAKSKKGKEFKVIFSHVQCSEEAYSGTLNLRTNYADRPTLRIYVLNEVSGDGISLGVKFLN